MEYWLKKNATDLLEQNPPLGPRNHQCPMKLKQNGRKAKSPDKRSPRGSQAKAKSAPIIDRRSDYFYFNHQTRQLVAAGKMVGLVEWLEREYGKSFSRIIGGIIRREHKAVKAAKAAGTLRVPEFVPYIRPFPEWLETLGVVHVEPFPDLEAERARLLSVNARIWTAIAKHPIDDDVNEGLPIVCDVLTADAETLADWFEQWESWYCALPKKVALQYQPQPGKVVTK